MTATPDPSLRFLLPPDAPWLSNLAALWTTNAPLARQLENLAAAVSPLPTAHCPPPTHSSPCLLPTAYRLLSVEPSKSGPPTLIAQTPDGRSISLHSRYDPIAEAQKLAKPLKTENCIAFYVLGLGLGYHLEALFDLASEEALLFVFEPDLQLIATTLQHRDLSRLISSGRLSIITTADKSALFSQLTPHAALCSMGFEGLTHAPSLALHPEFFNQIQTYITEFAAYARTCLNTLVINGRRTAENIAHNISAYASTPSVAALKNQYQGKPAIIVSAGPSLRKNKHHLQNASGKAVIIAVQTILQPLIDMGIEPHFVTSLDYHDISTRYYEKLPRNLRTHLIAEPKASPKIFDVFPGPVTVLGNDQADNLLRELTKNRDKVSSNSPRLEKAKLPSGATVAHLAYYVAEHLGCDPIIFVGQDLGFSDGLAYAPGTNIDDVWRPELSRFCTIEMKQWEFIARDRPILRKIPDQQDRPMYTEERLYTYLQQFERDFLKTKTQIIDATEGGAKKRGATSMTLEQAIQQFCASPLTASEPPTEHFKASSPLGTQASALRASLTNRIEEARQIESISAQTLPLLEQIRDNLADQPAVNRAISRIDTLRARMDTFGPTYELILQFTQSSELERFQRDRKIAAAKLAGADLQRSQIERDIENVRAIQQASRLFQTTITQALTRIGPALQEAA